LFASSVTVPSQDRRRAIVGYQVTIEVTLAIEPAAIGGKTTAIVATHLVELGGTLVSWRPEMNGEPAMATFDFPTEGARDQFVPGALKIRGVSLASRE
jgi:hypothetical protein